MVTDQAIESMYLRVVKVFTFFGRKSMTNASGFFYLHNSYLYLITARHVVINESQKHYPDSLHCSMHSNSDDLTQRAELQIPLYQSGIPQWRQHPRYLGNMDMVAVAVNNPQVLANHFMDTFGSKDLVSPEQKIPLGQDVLIVGFPLGFHDTYHNLPVVRRAMIASSYGHPFKGEPYFLTDARMHRGTSGAPVIARIPDSDHGISSEAATWRLLGVHSSALDVSDRNLQEDEKLGLNITWYAYHIPEMLT
jgi:hypothetical protein